MTPLARALAKKGYDSLTPVQQAMAADDLHGRDALVSAQTGSGKTVAFGIAMAPTLLGKAHLFGPAGAPLGLIIAPTRELALQVMRELQWLYAETGARFGSCVGGMDARTERRTLERGVHIVVGTPGRLRDHIEDLEFILDSAPDQRRTLLFSATVSHAIAQLAKTYQQDALRIETKGGAKQHSDIEYRALLVKPADKENAIVNLLRYYEANTALVFCATRAAVNHLSAKFHNRGMSVVALSGELTQNERSHALQAMRDGRARVCIATDVAARGIDLPGLDLVIHADLPQNKEALLHRSGRTGRAGAKGVSALIVPVSQRKKAQRLLGWAKVTAKWDTPPSAAQVQARDDERLLDGFVVSEDVDSQLIDRLLAEYSAEQIAAAYITQYRSNRSAPEDLQSVDLNGPAEKAHRDGFDNSVWVSLSVGRKHNAEPRWLLPMMCRGGDIARRDIGAIRVQKHESFVELNADALEGFMQALKSGSELEEGIQVANPSRKIWGPMIGVPKNRGTKHRARENSPSRQGSARHLTRSGDL